MTATTIERTVPNPVDSVVPSPMDAFGWALRVMTDHPMYVVLVVVGFFVWAGRRMWRQTVYGK
jgi:hypothetical protein